MQPGICGLRAWVVTEVGTYFGAVKVQLAPGTLTSSPVALEAGFAVYGSTIVSVNRLANWQNNPGNVIFGWEIKTDVDPGPGENLRPVGLQYQNSGGSPEIVSALASSAEATYVSAALWPEQTAVYWNVINAPIAPSGIDNAEASFIASGDAEVFAALGSTFELDPNVATEVFRFETLGQVPTTVEWGGVYGETGMGARVAQVILDRAVNFDGFQGSVSAVPEINSLFAMLAAGLLAGCVSIVNRCRARRSFSTKVKPSKLTRRNGRNISHSFRGEPIQLLLHLRLHVLK
jgi:hypothetical protein